MKKNDYVFPVFLRSPIIIYMCVITEVIESGRIQTDSLQAPALAFQETEPELSLYHNQLDEVAYFPFVHEMKFFWFRLSDSK